MEAAAPPRLHDATAQNTISIHFLSVKALQQDLPQVSAVIKCVLLTKLYGA
jgi:hypothetical protein